MPRIGQTAPTDTLQPFWQTQDGVTARLYLGHVLDILRRMPSQSVQCTITSPPYYNLRDYQTGGWEGGSSECNHIERTATSVASSSMLGPKRHLGISLPETNAAYKSQETQYKSVCGKCGARRIDQQIGSEDSPDCGQLLEVEPGLFRKSNCAERDWNTGCFTCRMVVVFRELRRVLRNDGCFFLNLGDGFSSGGRDGGGNGDKQTTNKGSHLPPKKTEGFADGNLIGTPWRVALALQEDGWVLRSNMIWIKRSAMPNSTDSRPGTATENFFMFTKSMDYYFDMDAIKPKGKGGWSSDGFLPDSDKDKRAELGNRMAATGASRANRTKDKIDAGVGRNFRNTDLWFQSIEAPHGVVGTGNEILALDIPSQPYQGGHFAVYAPTLITPLICAATSEYGCCSKCQTPYTRITNKTKVYRERANDYVKRTGEEGTGNSCANSVAGVSVETIGWEPGCRCSAEVIPCIVLDPFGGTCTTVATACTLGRRGIGIDLSEDYLRNHAIGRIEEAIRSGSVPRSQSPRRDTLKAPPKRRMI
jgi:DNA modification methylase